MKMQVKKILVIKLDEVNHAPAIQGVAEDGMVVIPDQILHLNLLEQVLVVL